MLLSLKPLALAFAYWLQSSLPIHIDLVAGQTEWWPKLYPRPGIRGSLVQRACHAITGLIWAVRTRKLTKCPIYYPNLGTKLTGNHLLNETVNRRTGYSTWLKETKITLEERCHMNPTSSKHLIGIFCKTRIGFFFTLHFVLMWTMPLWSAEQLIWKSLSNKNIDISHSSPAKQFQCINTMIIINS